MNLNRLILCLNNLPSIGNLYLGNLSDLYPEADYAELKDMRLSNWGIFKSFCDTRKSSGETIILPSSRIEMFKPEDQTIILSSGNILSISGGVSTDIIIFPFTPREDSAYEAVFQCNQGSSLIINNIGISQDYKVKYESYQCVLRKDANPKKIELLGDVRADFWNEISIGKTCFYGWEFQLAGRNNNIESWDEGTQTLLFTDDINAPVTNNMSGDWVWFGTHFNESISGDDYDQYGNYWSSYNEGINIFATTHTVATEDVLVTLGNVTLRNFNQHFNMFSPAAITLSFTDCLLTGALISANLFTRDENARSSVTFDNLSIEDSGYSIVGGREYATAGNILGSGFYIHPNVVVNGNNLQLHNNLAAAFRQYSGSGAKPVNPEDVSIFNGITATNNTEYDILLSSSMPTTVNNANCTNNVFVSQNTVLNGGSFVNILGISLSQPEVGVESIVEMNDIELNGYVSMGWGQQRQSLADIDINGLSLLTTITGAARVLSEVNALRSLDVNDISITHALPVSPYVDGEPRPSSPTYADALIRVSNISEVNINNLNADRFWVRSLFISSPINDPVGHLLKIRITNSSILCSSIVGSANSAQASRYINDMIEISNTIVRNDIGRQTLTSAFFKCTPISATFGSIKSIDSTLEILDPKADADSNLTFNNVLQIDFEHDRYNVNSGTIQHIAPILRGCRNTNQAAIMTMTGCYNGSIYITAIGGDIIFTKFDSVTNVDGNILNDFTLLSGQTAQLIPTRNYLFKTGSDITVTNELIGTGNGTSTVFLDTLSRRVIIPGTVTVTDGVITGSDNGNGSITGAGIAYGFIDYLGGSIYVEFSSPVTNGVQVLATFDRPNILRQVGGWSVGLE